MYIVWLEYPKAYHVVQHSLILKGLNMVAVGKICNSHTEKHFGIIIRRKTNWRSTNQSLELSGPLTTIWDNDD